MKVGVGFDVHAFDVSRPLILGGVTIPGAAGLAGWSDGDVLTHALIDAMLGGAGLGDIGDHFPSSQVPEGISSLGLLSRAASLVDDAGYRVSNADSVIVVQEVRLIDYKNQIAKTLAGSLSAEDGTVTVKATTTDLLGFTGRGEGIAAMVVVMLEELR